jgi:hypothetical protein
MLPPHPTLPTHHLAACFNNTSATYKFYWLLAILDAVQQQQHDIPKIRLFAGMLSNAWYTVNYFHVSFGPQDLIQHTAALLKDLEGISIDEQKQTVYERLLNPTFPRTTKLLKHFDKQVPHWFLKPWYSSCSKKEIQELSQHDIEYPLYQLHHDRIIITPAWFAYLNSHLRILRDYCYWNLSLFLQVRNPNVPDIAGKLIKPVSRNTLIKQRRFWDFVIERNGPIDCIYTGNPLHKGAYHVEHFVPYSFVSHDQIWNLIPSDNSFNISKSNKLPPLDRYFDHFHQLQELALHTFIREKPSEKLLEDYFYIVSDPNKGLPKEQFYNIIQPLVTIANNNGFTYMR